MNKDSNKRHAQATSRNKKMVLKSFKDLNGPLNPAIAMHAPPMGAVQNPADHPVNNLADRGGMPLGQSGEQQMQFTDMSGEGNTGMTNDNRK